MDLIILYRGQETRMTPVTSFLTSTSCQRENFKRESIFLLDDSSVASGLKPTTGQLQSRVLAHNPTRGLLTTDHVILNHGQVTWTTPEMAPPLLTTTSHQREDVSALDRFNVHRCPTRRVWARTRHKVGHDSIPIPLGYRGLRLMVQSQLHPSIIHRRIT
ncbi:uncharacterized protein TNCV_1854001 [Trichonephila clavipes]|nr:uncharacterized protein TNCV_1854001 [Trichonephila clavipes]